MSGLGGWGDPDDDYTVHDGGFRDLLLAYPVPHHVRRNFTLLAWKDIPSPLVADPLKIGNTSFSASVVESLLETPAGDYKGFQTVLEALQVRIAYCLPLNGLPHFDVNVRAHTVACTQPCPGKLLHHHVFSTSHLSPPLAILSDSAQLVPHLIVSKRPHGHRTVRLHTGINLSLRRP